MPLFLSDIVIYPIKSCSGISLKESNVGVRGLEHDRRWMVVNENGLFLSQRKFPPMVLIKVEILENGLKVYAPQVEPLTIPIVLDPKHSCEVEVWG